MMHDGTFCSSALKLFVVSVIIELISYFFSMISKSGLSQTAPIYISFFLSSYFFPHADYGYASPQKRIS